MAGIGFALRRLVHRDDLLGVAEGYGAATLITSGPWLFTIACLASIGALLRDHVSPGDQAEFRAVLIYSFCFSLIFSGPTAGVAVRYVADCIYKHNLRSVPSVLYVSLGVTLAGSLLVAGPFVAFALDLSRGAAIAAIMNFCLVSCIWTVSLFLSTLREHTSYAVIFAVGLVASFAGVTILGARYGLQGMLHGFNIGLALILFTIIGRTLAAFPQALTWPKAFVGYFRRYWELAASGIALTAALWVDKWVMWFAPEQQVVAGGLRFHPDYDVAMYLAYLTIIPAIAVFMVSFETGLFERVFRYFSHISHHAPYEAMLRNRDAIRDFTFRQLRKVIALQALIAALAIWFAPQLLPALGGTYSQMGIFRLGVLGASFHVLLLFMLLFLSYFDRRRLALGLHVLLFACNGIFSWISREMGFSYYGLGYFLASLVTFLAAYGCALVLLERLPYYTFIARPQADDDATEGT